MARMKIYRRMLYVGLGGTGLRIGMQLEQALRSELCGPDGRTLLGQGFSKGIQPYQLPRCAQFVYFDFDEADRGTASQAGTATAGAQAWGATAQVVGNLTPTQDSFSYAAESLRISARETVDWLPPKKGEPQRSPLSEGAGQLPTVGRAALFETFRANGGPDVVTGPLKEAFSRLSASMGDLNAVSGDNASTGVDVFVGFSVAGGTGAGIFYDVLRLIGQVALETGNHDGELAIHPLVVLPSAFEERGKLERSLRLNGGPALKELFELVDIHHTEPRAVPEIAYPGLAQTKVEAPVPTKTAFLFSRPGALTIDDLHRSIVAFVLSAIGTTVQTDRGEEFRPLTSHLINVHQLAADAPDGVGHRPVSTALAAELRIPVEEIATILSARLLANATEDLRRPGPTEEEDNLNLFDRFGARSGLDQLIKPDVSYKLRDVKGVGAATLTDELTSRSAEAVRALGNIRRELQPQLARLAAESDYGAAIESLAANHDLFRISRVVLGHPSFKDAVVRDGFRGAVTRIGQEPPQPPREGFGATPPPIPSLKDSFAGAKRVRANDPRVRQAIALQNEWYRWRVDVEVHTVWKSFQETWEPRLRQMQDRVRDVMQTFEDHATAEREQFHASCQRLYRERTGVVYFVPDGGQRADLDDWYRTAVLPRLCEVLGLPEGAEEGRVLRQIMHGRWAGAYEQISGAGSFDAAREHVLHAVRKVLTEQVLASGDETSLLPRIETLLRAAAHHADNVPTDVSPRLLEIFRRSLQQLLPTDFRPEGSPQGDSGHLKIHVFYPSAGKDGRIEDYLSETALAAIQEQDRSFHALGGVDFLSIVLRREALSATAVNEYRAMMQLRADALRTDPRAALLPWRQRLGYDPNWLVLRPSEGARILAALLTAMWDGSIRVVEGTPEDPKRLHVFQEDEDAGEPMELVLEDAIADVSRWCGLVSAYEHYVLLSDKQAQARCERLLERTSPASPRSSELYRTFQGLRADQERRARKLWEQLTEQTRKGGGTVAPKPRALEFWVGILKEAEDYNRTNSETWLGLMTDLGEDAA